MTSFHLYSCKIQIIWFLVLIVISSALKSPLDCDSVVYTCFFGLVDPVKGTDTKKNFSTNYSNAPIWQSIQGVFDSLETFSAGKTGIYVKIFVTPGHNYNSCSLTATNLNFSIYSNTSLSYSVYEADVFVSGDSKHPNFINANGSSFLLEGFSLSYFTPSVVIKGGSGLVRNCLFSFNKQAISVENSSFVCEQSTFFNNTCSAGGAIAISGGQASLLHNNFSQNYAVRYAGAVLVKNCTNVSVSNNIFQLNRASDWGGGLFLENTQSASIDVNLFTRNRVVEEGGALFFDSHGSCSMSQNTFEYNHAHEGAAVQLVHSNKIQIDNCTFNFNDGRYGPAVHILAQSEAAELSRCTFEGNCASLISGAIHHNGKLLSIYCSKFFKNTSGKMAGALFLNNGSITSINESVFRDNTATFVGGTLFAVGCNLTISKSTFSGSRSHSGGVLLISSSSNVNISDSNFLHNCALLGATMDISESSVTLTNVVMEKGSAEINGGALYINTSTVCIQNCSFLNNTAESEGGSISLNSSSIWIFGSTFQDSWSQG